ncbi:MAG: Fe-S cluster assembly sulfur transfer protein SufU [Candidatus Binataceae bacterium]
MAELDDIYPEALKAHYERPHNLAVLDDATATDTESNPLCGDDVSVYVKTDGSAVAAVTFQGHLCAVAMASASMMSEAVKDKTLDEVAKMGEAFAAMMRGSDSVSLGELDALRSVRKYRVRVRCALLPWEALRKACDAAR